MELLAWNRGNEDGWSATREMSCANLWRWRRGFGHGWRCPLGDVLVHCKKVEDHQGISMYKADGTSTDDEKGEKVRNSLISNVAEKVAEKLDLDSQSGVHESTEMDKSELLVEKVHDGVERGGGSENIEEQTIDSEKSLSEVQILFPREETVNQYALNMEQYNIAQQLGNKPTEAYLKSRNYTTQFLSDLQNAIENED
ncbi:hypothetical protein SESBI_19900 [Sesbania bispinosa]|nr:hypothetical protein SESBI_19900 [Sesbania bispinosa]